MSAPHSSAPHAQGPGHARQDHHEEHHASAGFYGLIWFALLILTGLTVYTGHMHLGKWALPLALTIATIKAALVALFFMHLWNHRGATRIIFVTSVVFALLLMGLTLSDVATRFHLSTPEGAPFGTQGENHGDEELKQDKAERQQLQKEP